MKIIFLRDVRGIGRRNEIKEVSDGYARHFLIAKKLAATVTPEALVKQAVAVAHEEALIRKNRVWAEQLSRDPLVFMTRADDKGTLFGGISRDEILSALQKKGYGVTVVALAHPLKALGEYTIAVQFSRGITGTVIVRIIAAE